VPPRPHRAATRPDPILGLALALLVAVACGPAAPPGIRSVSSQEIVAALGAPDGPLLLDVRTRAEFARGHVPHALLVPVAELPARLDEVRGASAGREVVVYCERGGRAERAARTLIDAGFEAVGHLEGDMSAWRTAGFPSQP